MSLTAEFYEFAKRQDSTKRPTAGTGQTLAILLKSPCTVGNPQIELALTGTEFPQWNYCYIKNFYRYYYIDNWEYNAGVWTAAARCDLLATYRTEIGKSTQYILRSSAAYDGDIIDSYYPTATDITITEKSASVIGDEYATNLSGGTFVVGVINNDTSAVGAVSYYAFTNAQFRAFCSQLMSNPDWLNTSTDEISNELLEALFNPFEYIVSCIWLPVSVSGTAVSSLKYGWWSFSTSCSRVSATAYISTSYLFALDDHPQISRGAYLNCSLYRKIALFWPLYGTFELDGMLLRDTTELDVTSNLDLITGTGTLLIQDSTTGVIFYRGTGYKIGVPIQIAQIATDYLGVANSALGIAGNLMSGNLAGVFSGITSAIDAVNPQMATSGSNGNLGVFQYPPIVREVFYPLVSEDIEHLGRPLCADRKISSIPGYIKTREASISIPAYAQDGAEIERLMNEGFYYE